MLPEDGAPRTTPQRRGEDHPAILPAQRHVGSRQGRHRALHLVARPDPRRAAGRRAEDLAGRVADDEAENGSAELVHGGL